MRTVSKLDAQLDNIISDIIEGLTFKKLSEKYNSTPSNIWAFLNSQKAKDKYQAALADSSNFYAEKAEQALLDAKANKVEIMRARELAQHYRWLASKRNPRQFGEKLDLNHSGEVAIKQITGMEIK